MAVSYNIDASKLYGWVGGMVVSRTVHRQRSLQNCAVAFRHHFTTGTREGSVLGGMSWGAVPCGECFGVCALAGHFENLLCAGYARQSERQILFWANCGKCRVYRAVAGILL